MQQQGNQSLVDLAIFVVSVSILAGAYMHLRHEPAVEPTTTILNWEDYPRSFPRLENHCSGCLRCREMANGEGVPICGDGMELFRHDLRDRWSK